MGHAKRGHRVGETGKRIDRQVWEVPKRESDFDFSTLRLFEPDFNFIAIGVCDEREWVTWAEVALTQNRASGALNGLNGSVDIGSRLQTKAEVRNTTGNARSGGVVARR